MTHFPLSSLHYAQRDDSSEFPYGNKSNIIRVFPESVPIAVIISSKTHKTRPLSVCKFVTVRHTYSRPELGLDTGKLRPYCILHNAWVGDSEPKMHYQLGVLGMFGGLGASFLHQPSILIIERYRHHPASTIKPQIPRNVRLGWG